MCLLDFLCFRNSVEKLCVSWALSLVEYVAVGALKLLPYSKPTSHKVFLLNYWNFKKANKKCPFTPNFVPFTTFTIHGAHNVL